MTVADQFPSAEFPATVTYIAFHALRRPDDVAVIVNGNEISYQAFYRDIGCFVAALRKLGLVAGQTAGIEHPHLYLHWLAVLALEALGVTSFSYNPDDVDILQAELRAADFLLCTPEGVPEGARALQLLNQPWIDDVRQTAPETPIQTVPVTSETPLRLTRSSGTTGSLKRMYHTARIREFWVRKFLLRANMTQRSRYLISIGFVIEAMHHYTTAAIRIGATCIFDGRSDLANVLVKQQISHVALPAYALKLLVGGLKEDYEKPQNLTLFVISAAVPSELRQRIRERLADEIVESYGTSEAGGICDMDGNGVGRVLPGVQVEVLDDSNRPVIGAVGQVRIRSEGVVAGYIDAPEATERMFRNGWFYPGDLGMIQPDQTLKLIGRADDILNVGGIKFAPEPIEEKLRASLPVDDLCLVALPSEDTLNRLCIVVVPQSYVSLDDLKVKIAPLLPDNFGTVEWVTAGHVPRTETGKVKRNDLVQALQNWTVG